MKDLNPFIVNFWLLGGAAGYAFDGGRGLAWGLLITSFMTLMAALIGHK